MFQSKINEPIENKFVAVICSKCGLPKNKGDVREFDRACYECLSAYDNPKHSIIRSKSENEDHDIVLQKILKLERFYGELCSGVDEWRNFFLITIGDDGSGAEHEDDQYLDNWPSVPFEYEPTKWTLAHHVQKESINQDHERWQKKWDEAKHGIY